MTPPEAVLVLAELFADPETALATGNIASAYEALATLAQAESGALPAHDPNSVLLAKLYGSCRRTIAAIHEHEEAQLEFTALVSTPSEPVNATSEPNRDDGNGDGESDGPRFAS